MFNKIGFIGVGNMAAAIIQGIVPSVIAPENVTIYDIDTYKTKDMAQRLGINACGTANGVVLNSDMTILCVKPNVVPIVAKEIAKAAQGKHIVSIAAGVSAQALLDLFSPAGKTARIMPNTPALVGAGMMAISDNTNYTPEELAALQELFGNIGIARIVPDRLMDAVTGLSGSGPAFVYQFIEALSDGAVAEGMPREMAYTFAAQTVLGSAKMVLETGEHPGKLKDNVCSPGGTTIAGVIAMENNAFRKATISAVKAAAEKSREMAQK